MPGLPLFKEVRKYTTPSKWAKTSKIESMEVQKLPLFWRKLPKVKAWKCKLSKPGVKVTFMVRFQLILK